jgi:hypothetical protein
VLLVVGVDAVHLDAGQQLEEVGAGALAEDQDLAGVVGDADVHAGPVGAVALG